MLERTDAATTDPGSPTGDLVHRLDGGDPVTPLDLDDPRVLARVDTADFLACVEGFPRQVDEAWQLARSLRPFPHGRDVESVAVLGMGGSAMSGEIVGAVLARSGACPVQTVRGYELPAWIGRDTLVFAVSYSGNTEETLELFRQAVERGAPIVALTTGGALAQEAGAHGVPVCEVPKGLQPRAALGWLAIPMLDVCEQLGLVSGLGSDMPLVVEGLRRTAELCSRTSPAVLNPAKQLAAGLAGRQVWIYGDEGVPAVAAYRWKSQMNECAKAVASWHAFPELTHNEIVGWQVESGPAASRALLVLRDDRERPESARRIDTTIELVEHRFGFVRQVPAQGSSTLLKLLDLCYLGDFTATYLGIIRGVDPNGIELIDRLKEAARRGRPAGS